VAATFRKHAYDNNIICYMTTYNIELRNGKVVKLENGKVVNDK
jgi:hypothetical protein